MIIVWLFVLRCQKMVWKIYREVWKNEDFWVKNSTFHNRCRDNKGLIVSTPPVWLHYTIKTCVIGMPVTMCFFSFRCICGVSAGVSLSSFHTSRTLPTPTMSSPASPRPPSCGGSCLWVRERERERQTLKREKKEREREKRGTKRDRGGQLPRMQFAHISLVPAFSPADVHHPLNYTSPPLIWEGFNIVSALSLSEELQAFHDLFVGAPPVTPSELYRRGEDSGISLIVSATTHMCIHASVL